MADTYLVLFGPDNALVASNNNGGTGRNAALTGLAVDQTGTWTLKLKSRNNFRRYGRYELRVLASDP